MGTFGSGNFDSDYSADYLSEVTSKIVADIKTAMEDPSELEPDEIGGVEVPCSIELLVLIAKQEWMGTVLPEVETIKQWRKTFMEVWERCIDDLDPKPDHKANRRQVLERTFDELLEATEKYEPGS